MKLELAHSWTEHFARYKVVFVFILCTFSFQLLKKRRVLFHFTVHMSRVTKHIDKSSD